MSDLGALAAAVAVASLVLAFTTPAALPRIGPREATAIRSLVRRLRLARRRERAADAALEVLKATGAALRSGVPLAQALRLAIERAPRAESEPFDGALAAFVLGAPLDEALSTAKGSVADRRVAFALDALALVAREQLPTSRASVLVASVAERMSFERRLAHEVRARTGGLRAQIVLLALLVPAIACYLVLTMPSLAATLATPLGMYVLLPSAALLELAGIVASRRIVRGLS